ncbi:11001_t:CDS:2 [Ambispora leptoticha]|uniref:11001_t:CDS:1 n=1 Tax=Ambispora leptoticha TaxID=144679 RepID=A0A9N8VBT0_9GLOM|nr:11001_t:CDS:2 [Ambispora leptoticha]
MAFLHGVRNIVRTVGLGELKHVSVENDKIEFDPEKRNNISIIVRGHVMQGSITLLRDDQESKLLKINNKIYVTDDYIRVTITPVYTDNQLVLTIEGPREFTRVRHETEVIFPRDLSALESFSIECENANIDAYALPTLFFDRYQINNTNGNIDSRLLKGTNIILRTTNGNITGSYQPLAKFVAESSNGTIDSSVTSAVQPSSVELRTTNGTIKGFYRMAKNFTAKTTNGAVTVQGHLKENEQVDANLASTNGVVSLTMSKIYQGRFQLETTWGSTSVSELFDVNFETYNRTLKSGVKGTAPNGNNNIKLSTMNGAARLEFN